ncbi:DUF397 domain-containing protein [Streptomyces roseolilacinus]|jgi:hypothetical protein|uniref:DUF397 domain-containing protein n=1 Tax=Streptomyces roseolilacinus TaxID=66904 RepID=A0A918AYE4_9ACTN|nr:DUF397 domain-containing protein [Streptomyces roseolilacinus]GGQ01951.1 hypothetical protein GCM10010249_20520 [Streptomyces roseolilacinus]
MSGNDTIAPAAPEPAWFKSSYSGAEGGQCVEVAALSGAVRVRDSKHAAGPSLAFDGHQWASFVAYAKDA